MILDCYISLLNEDINDSMEQKLFHPSYFLEDEDIDELHKEFGSEFIRFVMKLKLVKTFTKLNKKHNTVYIERNDRGRNYLTSAIKFDISNMWDEDIKDRKETNFIGIASSFCCSCKTKKEKNTKRSPYGKALWLNPSPTKWEPSNWWSSDKENDKDDNKTKIGIASSFCCSCKTKKEKNTKTKEDDQNDNKTRGQQVTPCFIPLVNASTFSMLKRMVKASKDLDRPDIFGSGRILL